MKLPIQNIVRIYLPIAFAMTVCMGLVDLAVQQNFRMSANDPQIQIAEDFATELGSGQPVAQLNPNLTVDMGKSLSTFLLIYDNAGHLITGSGKLNGQYPTVPAGVLSQAKSLGENRITWQPANGVRIALVVKPYYGPTPGYVAVGRSLKEVEQREDNLLFEVIVAWLAGMIGLVVLAYAGEMLLSRRQI